jgi:hypothetical protein
MQGILYEEASIWQFLFITVILGGWAAWTTGKACAETWRSPYNLVVYILFLGVGVRFIHHALFDGTMFSLHYYVVDTVILLVLAMIGFRTKRTSQMVTQYYWLYEKVNAFSWKPRS